MDCNRKPDDMTDHSAARVVERLVEAVNDGDLDALVACFATDYVNETPVHPSRGFRGRDQVRTNWAQILAGVPGLRATVARSSIHAGTAWTEWELAGMRADGAAFLMRGVVIYEVRDDLLASARLFLEPVDPTGSDVNEAVRSVLGTVDLESPENTS